MKREIRVELSHRSIKWQFKRKDEERWDYDTKATAEEWDMLEDILKRRAHRGKGGDIIEAARKLRSQSNA